MEAHPFHDDRTPSATTNGGHGSMRFAIGDKVRLKACSHGEPGAVLRLERKLVIYWRDLI
jgi:hypothetical protein